jgi:hypothetical protein
MDKSSTMLLPFSINNSSQLLSFRLTVLFALILCAGIGQAAPKVFKAVLNEDVSIERVYEVRDIKFTITEALSNDQFLKDGMISGVVGLDAVSGRLIIEVNNLHKSGMAMQAVGYVESDDKEKGIPGCTLWQTRMFEDTKLCYAAKAVKGQEVKIVLSVEDEAILPSVAGQ